MKVEKKKKKKKSTSSRSIHCQQLARLDGIRKDRFRGRLAFFPPLKTNGGGIGTTRRSHVCDSAECVVTSSGRDRLDTRPSIHNRNIKKKETSLSLRRARERMSFGLNWK